jgi:hypothetical protein
MQKLKRTIKRIAAISSGAIMLGATVFGAAATTLGDYPAPFITNGAWTGEIVIGADAASSDTVGAIDIAASLAQQATTAVTSSTTTTVTGGVSGKAIFGEGIANSSVSDAVDYELEDDDIAGLTDSQITFNGTDYDVREMIVLNQDSPVVETSLTGSDDDYETTAYMEVARGAIAYYYLFDKAIDISSASSSTPVKIDFLGKQLKITSVADADTFTAYVGDEFFMSVGDSVVSEGKTVTLKNVGSATSNTPVILDVDGVQETVTGTETVNGLEITVDEAFYSDTLAERSATLIIGTESSETYDNGDRYAVWCGTKWKSNTCKKTDPDWIWDLNALTTDAVGDTTSGGGLTIGIKNDFVVNGDDDNPVVVGECYDFPNGFAEICFDSLTTTDYMDLTLELDTDIDISNAAGSAKTSEETIYIHAGEEDTLELQASAITGLDSDTKTDKVYLWINDSEAEYVELLYEDSNNDIIDAGYFNKSVASVSGNSVNVIDIVYGATKSSNIDVDFFWDNSSTMLSIILDVIDDDADMNAGADDIQSNWTSSSNIFASLGATTSTNEAGELYWSSSQSDISTKDEDHMTQYGIIIKDPKSHGASDEVLLQIPNDIVRANIIVSGPGTTTAATSTGGVSITSVAGVPLAKLDTEVTDKTSKPLILVGGPAVNRLTAEALGLTYPAYGAASGIPENKGMIKLVENAFSGTNVAMVVAGWTAGNTRDTCTVLKNFNDYATEFAGKAAVEISGTTVTELTTTPEVEEPVAE